MKKSSIIVALVALIVGVGLGLFISQTLSGEAPLPGATPAVQDANSVSEAISSVQPAEKIAAHELEQAQNQEQAGQQAAVSSNSANEEGELASNQSGESSARQGSSSQVNQASVVESGSYTSKDEVAAYIHEFGHLPPNYISKSKAKKAGWVAKEGNLDEVLPGMSIGGSEFYNDEGQLPDAPGRTWTECDINYEGGYRGSERIVFSSDGLIFYTADHYKTFEQLY